MSSSFGRQIARSAIVAVIVSLLLIVLYIAVRFGLKFSGPVIAALLHDIIITVGVYSLTGREVSNATVAAVYRVLAEARVAGPPSGPVPGDNPWDASPELRRGGSPVGRLRG